MMNEPGKSDSPIVPKKRPNETGAPEEEVVEERGLTKGNPQEQNVLRTQGRDGASPALERIRQAAKKDRKQRFTALLHHVYDKDRLLASYRSLRRDAAAGVDQITWEEYGQDLGSRLQDLSARLKRGAYRAQPTLRVQVPKPDGRLRPLGIPTVEDKIVQRAVTEVLNAIYEVDFLGFSYGFRPGRSPHQALDALTTGIMKRNVNWVLDADIRGFFDALDHGWLVQFLEHRIGDRRVIRLIQKWLRVGVLANGHRTRSPRGTVQGGSISPLLANVFLHYAFDLWVQQWRRKHARGDLVVVRFADDFAVGFEHRKDAEAFHAELAERLHGFGLELHPQKTRLIRFGRQARKNSDDEGPRGHPATFQFLGFTHICGTTRTGRFTVYRRTDRKRFQAKLREVRASLRRRMHHSIPDQARYLRAVIVGHARYFGVPMNSGAITRFRLIVVQLWKRSLERRSQRSRITWERMTRLAARWLPPARVCHPYPLERLGVTT